MVCSVLGSTLLYIICFLHYILRTIAVLFSEFVADSVTYKYNKYNQIAKTQLANSVGNETYTRCKVGSNRLLQDLVNAVSADIRRKIQ